jgi:hypothetical protein
VREQRRFTRDLGYFYGASRMLMLEVEQRGGRRSRHPCNASTHTDLRSGDADWRVSASVRQG